MASHSRARADATWADYFQISEIEVCFNKPSTSKANFANSSKIALSIKTYRTRITIVMNQFWLERSVQSSFPHKNEFKSSHPSVLSSCFWQTPAGSRSQTLFWYEMLESANANLATTSKSWRVLHIFSSHNVPAQEESSGNQLCVVTLQNGEN